MNLTPKELVACETSRTCHCIFNYSGVDRNDFHDRIKDVLLQQISNLCAHFEANEFFERVHVGSVVSISHQKH